STTSSCRSAGSPPSRGPAAYRCSTSSRGSEPSTEPTPRSTSPATRTGTRAATASWARRSLARSRRDSCGVGPSILEQRRLEERASPQGRVEPVQGQRQDERDREYAAPRVPPRQVGRDRE